MDLKMMIKVIVWIIIYFFLVAILYFGSIFMLDWGGASPWYIRIIAVMQNFPINLKSENGDIEIEFLFINALFWVLCALLSLYSMIYITKCKYK